MGKLRPFIIAWILISLFFSIEYLALHKVINFPSILNNLSCMGSADCPPLTPEPGKPLSYWLGWLGFSIMCLTNLYIFRKRIHRLRKLGKLQTWLNWHIFFGLVGPTFIVFHCDFKVGGLVAISFWSMIISASSGIVGRYFYLQLMQQKDELKKSIYNYEASFERYLKRKKGLTKKELNAALNHAFFLAGGLKKEQLAATSIWHFMLRSMIGEVRMLFTLPSTPWGASRATRLRFKQWALLRKRLISMHYFKALFGYWKSFHTPFAIFMYVVAIIHIISSLMFKVD